MDTRFLKSSTFRLAAVYMLLFSISVLLLLGFIYWSTVSYITSQTDHTIDIEIGDLTEAYRSRGLPALMMLMQERLSRKPAGPSIYLLTDKDLQPLIGNLDHWPLEAEVRDGWLDFRLEDAPRSEGRIHHARARLFRLEGGFMLLVGRDVHELDETRQRIVFTLLWGLLIMLALGSIGSVMMGRSTMRRIEAINEAAREIMSGDLGRRIPDRNTGDDFDLLANNLNRMLDQIESLMESVRQVSDNIAHDLRTPLAHLRNRLEEIQLDPGCSGHARELVEQAVVEADGLLSTFNALLRIARIESRDDHRNFANIDLCTLVQDVVELYEPLAEQKQQELQTDLQGPLEIPADRDLIFQAIANLLDNAIKYTPIKGHIGIRLEKTGQGARLVIADDGPGIPPEAREKVFQRFFRLEQSRTTPGNGLGMSLVAAVIRLHHMSIRLEDNEPGLRVVVDINDI